MTKLTIFLLLAVVAQTVLGLSRPPSCSLRFCTMAGANAICSFSKPSGGVVPIKCEHWPRLNPSACPRAVCRVGCPDLPKTGKYCGRCPDCRFVPESCFTGFRLFRPRTCPPSPPLCSLKYCSQNGSLARCLFRGKVIRCGWWPHLAPGVCPAEVCEIACEIPAKLGPVCSNCPDCAFFSPSCKSGFKLYRADDCP